MKKNPKDTAARVNLGKIYFQERNYSRAIRELQQAVQYSPRRAEAHYYLGLSYAEAKDRKNAIASLEKYLKLVPEAGNRKAVEEKIRKLRR